MFNGFTLTQDERKDSPVVLGMVVGAGVVGMAPSETLLVKFFATELKLIVNCTLVIFTLVGILHCLTSPMFVPSLVYITDPELSLNLTSYFTKQSPDSILFQITLTQPVEGFPAFGFGTASRFAVINIHILLISTQISQYLLAKFLNAFHANV